MNGSPDEAIATANATFCATLVDQWVIEGMTAAFISPGSRSTPLALACAADDRIATHLFHDERSASFAALGHAWATGTPAMIACTSGTAASHFYGAVIEAKLSALPLLVCTADRPPELWGRGAPQTIDQTHIFGEHVVAFHEPGPPDDTEPSRWRTLAQTAWLDATGARPGPVHLNLSFREPLAGSPSALPPVIDGAVPVTAAADPALIADLVDRVRGRRGVIIAGRNESSPDEVIALADRLGWPLLADHRSGCRLSSASTLVERFDSLLRHPPFAASVRPHVVLRIGEIVSSKAVSLWLRSLGPDTQVLSSRPHGRHIDPEDIATLSFDEVGVVAGLLAQLSESDTSANSEWIERWLSADRVAQAAVDQVVNADSAPNEIAICRSALEAVPSGGALVVASSMPVRDVEWFGGRRDDVSVISNRGANGIDGTIATAIGVAATGRPTVCLLGDVAFLHDSSSLAALARRSVDLTIVVIDNDGGGIFSFLPQHDLLELDRYEQLFGTPHGTDLTSLAAAHNLDVAPWPGSLTPSGVRVVIATTDRTANLRLHNDAHAAVANAVSRELGEPPLT